MSDEQVTAGEPELTPEEARALAKKIERAKIRAVLRRREAKQPHTITSLMDALTIILCFLLKSVGSEPMNISQNDDLRLPKSTTSLNPESDTVAITVTAKSILVGDRHVVDVKEGAVDKSRKKGGENSFMITPLFDGLTEEANHQKQIAKISGADFEGMTAIVSDQNTPYRLLLEVMYTAGQAEFGKFKFAVVKKRAD
jgi:biopolymer transport protein ExbD